MRRSIWDRSAFGWEVFLNGEPLRDCVEFDTRTGLATVYRRDEQGQLVVSGDHVATKVVRGKIKAKRRRRPWPRRRRRGP